MQIGLSSAAFYGRMNTEDAAKHLADFQLDTCEVFLETFSEYNMSFGKLVRERMGSLPCVSVHPKGTQFESDLFASYARQRKDAMQIFDGICSAGEMLGASFYVLHGPPGFKTDIRPENIRNIRTVFPEMQRVAADHGIEIVWENVSWCACSKVENIVSLLDMFPEQRFVLDIKQALHAGVDPLLMARAMGEHLAHVHVLDWNEEGKLVLPGDGIFPFKDLMDILWSCQFHGAVILEPYSYQTLDEDKVHRSLRFLRNIIAR